MVPETVVVDKGVPCPHACLLCPPYKTVLHCTFEKVGGSCKVFQGLNKYIMSSFVGSAKKGCSSLGYAPEIRLHKESP